MVEIADIVDQESLEAWLKDQPKKVSVWIAWRAGMRVLPFYWYWALTAKENRKKNLPVLPVLQSSLTSGLAFKLPTTEIVDVAEAIPPVSAVSIPDSAVNAAAVAVRAANAARSAVTHALTKDAAAFAGRAVVANVELLPSEALWILPRADCEAVNIGVNLDHLFLWPDGENPFSDVWAKLKSKCLGSGISSFRENASGAEDVDWSFWIKWYDSILAGAPLDGAMLKEIALIEPAEWDKGPARVNFLIGEIEQKYAREATPYPETLTYDGEYHVVPISKLPARSLKDARDRIADVSRDMRKSGNQYSALGDEADVLDDVLERYPDRAIRLFEVCHKVVGHVARHIENGVLPEGDNLIGDVLGDLQNSADDIYNFDAEVRATVDARAKLRFGRLDQGQRDTAVALAEAVAQNSDADLAEEIREDAAEVMAAVDPEGESKPARYRLGSRLVRILVLGGAGLAAVLGTLAAVEPAVSGAQYLWQIIWPLIGF